MSATARCFAHFIRARVRKVLPVFHQLFRGQQCKSGCVIGGWQLRCCLCMGLHWPEPGNQRLARSRYRSGRARCLMRCATRSPNQWYRPGALPMHQDERCQPLDDEGLCAQGAQHRCGGAGVPRWWLSRPGHGSGREGDLRLADRTRHHLRAAEIPRAELGPTWVNDRRY